VVTGIFH